MKKICVICGKPVDSEEDWWWCEKPGCNEKVLLCEDCSDKFWGKIRCPRHFLKSHREDVARYKKEALK